MQYITSMIFQFNELVNLFLYITQPSWTNNYRFLAATSSNKKHFSKKLEKLQEIGMDIAVELVAAGEDASPVLRVYNLVRGGENGSRRLSEIWVETEALLQGIAMRLDWDSEPLEDPKAIESNPEVIVAEYIKSEIRRKVDIQKLTRDRIAQATGLSQGVVSSTSVWKQFVIVKKQQKIPFSIDAQIERAINNNDWKDLESLQRQESRRQKPKHHDI